MDTANLPADNPATVPQEATSATQPDYSMMGGDELTSAMAQFIASAGNPPAEEGASIEQDQQTQDADQIPAAPEPGAQIPDKFRNPDGSVNTDALVKSYLNLETAYHERNQIPPDWQQKEAWYMSQLNNLTQAQQGAMAQEQGQEEAPATVEDMLAAMSPEEKDTWFESFYEEPDKALMPLLSKLLEQKLNPILEVIEPIKQDREFQADVKRYSGELDALRQKHGDITPVLPIMDQISQEMPYLTAQPNAMETIFKLSVDRLAALSMRQQMNGQQQPTMTPEQMAADPAVRQMVLSQHINGLQKGAPPVVMSNQPGRSGMPAAPNKDINSIKDAIPGMTAYLRQAMNGG